MDNKANNSPEYENNTGSGETSGETQNTDESGNSSDEEADKDTDVTGEESEDRIKAWDFTVYDYDGNQVTLYDYIGTPIVLNFWASWCGPCRMEMPHFNKVSQEYSDDELIF